MFGRFRLFMFGFWREPRATFLVFKQVFISIIFAFRFGDLLIDDLIAFKKFIKRLIMILFIKFRWILLLCNTGLVISFRWFFSNGRLHRHQLLFLYITLFWLAYIQHISWLINEHIIFSFLMRWKGRGGRKEFYGEILISCDLAFMGKGW